MEISILKIVTGIFVAIAILGLVNSLIISKEEKIFTIGKIYDTSEPGKRGTTYYFKYYIKGKEFLGSTEGLYKFNTNKNGHIFIEVIKTDFTKYHVLEFSAVPDCLTLNDVPDNGWGYIPDSSGCK